MPDMPPWAYKSPEQLKTMRERGEIVFPGECPGGDDCTCCAPGCDCGCIKDCPVAQRKAES